MIRDSTSAAQGFADSNRLMKKARLRAPILLMGTRALARRCDVRTEYASHLHPSCGWVPGAPPCIWTFLSSLGENGFFSILLGERHLGRREPPAEGTGCLEMALGQLGRLSEIEFALAFV